MRFKTINGKLCHQATGNLSDHDPVGSCLNARFLQIFIIVVSHHKQYAPEEQCVDSDYGLTMALTIAPVHE